MVEYLVLYFIVYSIELVKGQTLRICKKQAAPEKSEQAASYQTEVRVIPEWLTSLDLNNTT
jgi:hypothetical protein